MLWLARNFSVTANPGKSEHSDDERWMYFYFMYGLERAGMLFGTETIGKHRWYREGAEYLLKEQSPGGSWNGGANGLRPAVDTCFAILFLRRATRNLPRGTSTRSR